MSESKEQSSGRKRRWPKILLYSSLCLNLVLVGLIAGALAYGMFQHDRNVGRMLNPAGLGVIVGSLDPDMRSKLAANVRKGGFERIGYSARSEEHFEAFMTTLKATPFQPEELDLRFAEQREEFTGRMERSQLLLGELIKSMTDEERQALASRLEGRYDWPRRKHGRR